MPVLKLRLDAGAARDGVFALVPLVLHNPALRRAATQPVLHASATPRVLVLRG
jgi:hypothetical protein